MIVASNDTLHSLEQPIKQQTLTHLRSPLNNRPCTHLSSTLNETLHSPEKPIKRDPPSHHWVQHLNLQTPSSESPWGHVTYQCVWVDRVMEISHPRHVQVQPYLSITSASTGNSCHKIYAIFVESSKIDRVYCLK